MSMGEIDAMTLWWIAVGVAVIVTAIVAMLLRLIVSTAGDIEGAVSEVWTSGQRVANNTIHIASLHRTVEAAEGILGRAGRILGHSQAIAAHAETCPGCPGCILSRRS